ncbi:hypothetical protein NHX12_004448, partial [Muraenolepis orangiensis]
APWSRGCEGPWARALTRSGSLVQGVRGRGPGPSHAQAPWSRGCEGPWARALTRSGPLVQG